MNYERYDEDSANPIDQLAWMLCQIIDDDAPLQWTKYRGPAICLLSKKNNLRNIIKRHDEDEQEKKL